MLCCKTEHVLSTLLEDTDHQSWHVFRQCTCAISEFVNVQLKYFDFLHDLTPVMIWHTTWHLTDVDRSERLRANYQCDISNYSMLSVDFVTAAACMSVLFELIVFIQYHTAELTNQLSIICWIMMLQNHWLRFHTFHAAAVRRHPHMNVFICHNI